MFHFDSPQNVQFMVPMHFDWMWKIKSCYICLRNCIVNWVGIMIINGTLYQVPWSQSNSFMHKGKIVEEYDSAIVLTTRLATMFWHWIKDILSPFLLIPQEVRDTTYMLIGGKPYFALETLEILGFNTSRAIILPNNGYYIFTRKFHTVYDNMPFLCHFESALKNFIPLYMLYLYAVWYHAINTW